jgi:hypothetical protein
MRGAMLFNFSLAATAAAFGIGIAALFGSRTRR